MLTGGLWGAVGQAGNDLAMAAVMINILFFSSESVTTTWLLPEMVERVASMLNYFLNVLTGEQWTIIIINNNKIKLQIKNENHHKVLVRTLSNSFRTLKCKAQALKHLLMACCFWSHCSHQVQNTSEKRLLGGASITTCVQALSPKDLVALTLNPKP